MVALIIQFVRPRTCGCMLQPCSTHTTIRYVTYLPAVSDGRMILTTCPRLRP